MLMVLCPLLKALPPAVLCGLRAWPAFQGSHSLRPALAAPPLRPRKACCCLRLPLSLFCLIFICPGLSPVLQTHLSSHLPGIFIWMVPDHGSPCPHSMPTSLSQMCSPPLTEGSQPTSLTVGRGFDKSLLQALHPSLFLKILSALTFLFHPFTEPTKILTSRPPQSLQKACSCQGNLTKHGSAIFLLFSKVCGITNSVRSKSTPSLAATIPSRDTPSWLPAVTYHTTWRP